MSRSLSYELFVGSQLLLVTSSVRLAFALASFEHLLFDLLHTSGKRWVLQMGRQRGREYHLIAIWIASKHIKRVPGRGRGTFHTPASRCTSRSNQGIEIRPMC